VRLQGDQPGPLEGDVLDDSPDGHWASLPESES